jgi:ribosome maturation protein Sdo1
MEAKCYFSASSAKDVFYLVKRHTGSLEKAKKAIVSISAFATFCDTTKQDVENALQSIMVDFVITRNKKDFASSIVKAITPAEFLEIHRI